MADVADVLHAKTQSHMHRAGDGGFVPQNQSGN